MTTVSIDAVTPSVREGIVRVRPAQTVSIANWVMPAVVEIARTRFVFEAVPCLLKFEAEVTPWWLSVADPFGPTFTRAQQFAALMIAQPGGQVQVNAELFFGVSHGEALKDPGDRWLLHHTNPRLVMLVDRNGLLFAGDQGLTPLTPGSQYDAVAVAYVAAEGGSPSTSAYSEFRGATLSIESLDDWQVL